MGFEDVHAWARSRGIEAAPRLEVAYALLSSRPAGRLLDLGAGHGKFSLLANDLGWQVTAVDARGDRFPEDAGDEVDWLVGDVRELDVPGPFDLVFNLGLLYHLELDDQLALLRWCSRWPTVVDTHAAVTPHVTVDGWQGAWFDERTEKSTASVGNTRSFWPIEPELVRQFKQSGFGAVWRLTPETTVGRTFWLCLPAGEKSALVDQEPEPSRHELGRDLRRAEAELDEARAQLARQAGDRATVRQLEQERDKAQGDLARLLDHPAVRAGRGVRRLARRVVRR